MLLNYNMFYTTRGRLRTQKSTYFPWLTQNGKGEIGGSVDYVEFYKQLLDNITSDRSYKLNSSDISGRFSRLYDMVWFEIVRLIAKVCLKLKNFTHLVLKLEYYVMNRPK